jgi:hypothetical protein
MDPTGPDYKVRSALGRYRHAPGTIPGFGRCGGAGSRRDAIRLARREPSSSERIPMKALLLGVAATVSLFGAALSASAADAQPAQLTSGVYVAGDAPTLQPTQFFFGGENYCWYGGGWQGPGYYYCGYEWRRGLGWGGRDGWNGWHGGGNRGGYSGGDRGGYRGGDHSGGYAGSSRSGGYSGGARSGGFRASGGSHAGTGRASGGHAGGGHAGGAGGHHR